MATSDLRAKIRLEGDASSANAAIKSTETRFQRLGSSIKKNALAITAVLASLAGAFRLVKDSAEQAGQSTAFQASLAAQGIAADEFLKKLQEVSAGQIANADLILASNRALALGIKADDLPSLLEAAAQASVKLGISTTQAFNDITTGVGRASPLILDNLGIVVDSVRVYEDYATSIGTTAEELTKAQRTQALTKAVLASSLDTTKKFTDAQDKMTIAINTSSAAMKNLKSSSGTVLSGFTQLLGATASLSAQYLSLIAEGFVKVARGVVFLGQLIPGLSTKLKGADDTLRDLDDGLDTFQTKLTDLRATLVEGGIATIQYGFGLKEVETKASLAAPAVDEVTEATEKAGTTAKETGGEIDELAGSFDSARESAYALQSGMTTAQTSIQQAGAQAVITSAQFDALAASAGRAAAVSAALAGGATLSQGGTRLNLPTHGSRLVNTSGTGGSGSWASKYSLSPFGSGGRYTVEPDGRMRPA